MIMSERFASVRGRRLAWLDTHPDGGGGAPILALHGHFGRARSFAPFAAALGGDHRVIALEQRGHGHSDRGDGDVSPDAYVADAAEFLRGLALGPVTVLGHSMGGVVAFKLAARHPELVSALVVEEGGALNQPPDVPHPVLDVRGWPRRAATLGELRSAIEAHGIPDAGYFLESAAEYPDGWGLLFDYDDMMASQRALIGDWWDDWLGSSCPALLVHGLDSFVLPTGIVREMAERRPRTMLAELAGCGHWVHDDDLPAFVRTVREFLSTLQHETIGFIGGG